MPRNTGHAGTERGVATAAVPHGAGPARLAEARQGPAMAFVTLHSRLLRNALEVNAELLDFVRRRLDADMRASRDLAACKTAAEAAEVVNGFRQRALEDYAEETGRVLQFGADAARRALEESRAETDEIMHRQSHRLDGLVWMRGGV